MIELLQIELNIESINFDLQINSRPTPLIELNLTELASNRNTSYIIYANSIDNKSKNNIIINPAGAVGASKDNNPIGITDYFSPNFKATVKSFNKDIVLIGGTLQLSINNMLYTINLEVEFYEQP